MIVARAIAMVRWCAFDAEDVELRGDTAFVGDNAVGKSSILDAVQLLLTGANRRFFRPNARAVGPPGARSAIIALARWGTLRARCTFAAVSHPRYRRRAEIPPSRERRTGPRRNRHRRSGTGASGRVGTGRWQYETGIWPNIKPTWKAREKSGTTTSWRW